MVNNNIGEVICNNRKYTSKELKEEISNIRGSLLRHNFCDGEVVGIVLNRTVQMLTVMVALWELGITFMPIDIDMPVERKRYMLKDAGVKKVITCSVTSETIEEEYEKIKVEDLIKDRVSVICNNRMKDERAYVLYTSGTTGNPKGIEITRNNLESFYEAFWRCFNMKEIATIASFSSFSFDIFFVETLLALIKGLTVILATDEEQKNPVKMMRILQENRIDILQMTPTRAKLIELQDSNLKCLQNIRILFLGGEMLPKSLLSKLQKSTKARIYNLYGTTETTIYSTWCDLTVSDVVSIGKPFINTEIYILNDMMQPVATGEVGEIYIGGKGVGKGYLNNEELTKKNFIFYGDEKRTRLYKTGDLGWVNKSGDIFCVGRGDNQVKIRGYRIELEDIENNILRIDPVKMVVVCLVRTEEQDYLVAFYKASKEISSVDFYNVLHVQMPSYMIPKEFVSVENFYYTNSGKIDKNRLIEWYIQQRDGDRTEDEEEFEIEGGISGEIVALIKENVKRNIGIDLDTNLLSIGVDSLTYLKIVVEIEKVYNIEFEEDKLIDEQMYIVGNLVDYVEKTLNGRRERL